MSLENDEKLFNSSFIAACSANFLYFFGFYSLLPIMALYLIDTFQTDKIITGAVMACYTIAAFMFRPFGGYLVDKLNRKKLYVIALAIFVLCFEGYPLASSLLLFVFFRILHGFSFGALTVTANTLVIDISPSKRRGEALGIYGIANTVAMAIGPMVAVYVQKYHGYHAVFYMAFILGIVAFFIGSTFIKAPKREPVEHQPLSWDRFILFKGLPAGSSLLLLGIPYGLITSYISIYSKELGLGIDSGWFYSLMAVGMVLSRIFSGKQTDRGKVTQVIALGIFICFIGLVLLGASKYSHYVSTQLIPVFFNFTALLLGFGYGMLFPAMNTLFVNLAPNNKRGTANSTYMTTWDIGIGIGLLFGAQIGDTYSYSLVFFLGAFAAIVSITIFVLFVTKHYERNKLR